MHIKEISKDLVSVASQLIKESAQTQLDELSKETVASYKKEAHKSMKVADNRIAHHKHALKTGAKEGSVTDAERKKTIDYSQNEIEKRKDGIRMANKRLNKEELELQELSKKTVKSYASNALISKRTSKGLAKTAEYDSKDKATSASRRAEFEKEKDDHDQTVKRREKGLKLAKKKLSGMREEFVVEHEEFGIGTTIQDQIYEDNTIDVMFDHGIENVSMDELEVIEKDLEKLQEGYDEQRKDYMKKAIDKAKAIAAILSDINKIEKYVYWDAKYTYRQLEDLLDSLEIVKENATKEGTARAY